MSARLPDSLPQLQNLIKRDPESYKDEFLQQYQHYHTMLEMFQRVPAQHDESLIDSVLFLAQVSHCYADQMSEFPKLLSNILHHHGQLLDSDVRMTFCKALILMRNKGLITPESLLELFFGLFRCQDKLLRKTLYNYVVQDIKKVNFKHKNPKLNTFLQNFMYKTLSDNSPIASKMSLDIMVEMYRRKIWNDRKTVNAVATCLTSKVTKILVTALRFFLSADDRNAKDDDSDSDTEKGPKKSVKSVTVAHRVGKKSKKRQKRLERSLAAIKNHKKKQKPDSEDFSAIQLLNNEQELGEKLFRQTETTTERFDVKIMMMDVLSRVISIHKLILFNFYPFLQRFLQPHQSEVTKVLKFLAQSSHDMVPPEIIESAIKTVVNNFVTERNSSEVMAVGLNAVREICRRCPLAMTRELLDDLVMYKNHKDKGVLMAARSLISLYRQINPTLLHKNNRGKPTEAMKEARPLEYGMSDALDYIPGAEVLDNTEKLEQDKLEQDDWKSCSESEDDDDEDGSWVDVSHSSDEEQEVSAEVKALTSEERNAKSRDIVHSRILTDDEFRQIQKRQIQKTAEADGQNKRSRKRPMMEDTPNHEEGEILGMHDIEGIYKKRRHDRESRLATVMEGREGREKFGRADTRMNPNASTTNREKRKTKNFQMVKHKIKASKGKRSFQDKRAALAQALIKKLKSKK